jgi:hypothetical protein
MGVLKLPKLKVPRLWNPITLQADLRLKCGLKQSCSSRRDLSNGMWHATCTQGKRGDFWLLMVGSQTSNLTLSLSFGHNLCFKCPNEQCELILDIYISRAFQWYKKRHKPLSFDPCNRSLKFRKSIGTPSPKVGIALGVWGFTPSYSFTLSNTPGSMWCDSWASSCLRLLLALTPGLPLSLTPGLPLALTPGLPLGPQPCNPFALVASPKLRLWHISFLF